MIEFRLLGPVTVGGGAVSAGHPRQRAVLAALLVDAGRLVTTETLIDRVWGDAPPATARKSLYSHASRVRRLLRETGAGALESQSGGYRLSVERERVDLHRFRDQVAVTTTPEQLPADVAAFTGRTAELDRLDDFLTGPEHGTDDVVAPLIISAVAGAAGVGKTALAVHWAHRRRARFPDGQLYVNLRGYDPEQPVSAADALAGFLGDLGVPAATIPMREDDRASRFRSLTAGRRMLVLLDNAASVEQVRPLLPGSSSCTVLVTSRDTLAGLVVLHGARRLDVDVLSRAEAVALVRRLIGARVDEDPTAAAALADRCDRLPLALRIAAEFAVARPSRPLAELVRDLADQRRRLELLDAGSDPRASVVPVFSWSLRHLPTGVARVFGLLGLHPGPDFDRYAVAALADSTVDEAARALEQLARAHLVETGDGGRYRMHDLLHAYAAGLAAGEEAGPDRPQAAVTRLYDYYLATASAAMDRLYPAERGRRPRVPPAATPVPSLTDPDTALIWLDANRRCLTTMAGQAAGCEWPAHAMQLSATLFRYLDGGHYIDALSIHGHALRAAERSGDVNGQAQARHALATVNLRLGRHGPAAEYFEQALELFSKTGDRIGQARALNNLGTAHMQVGRHGQAAAHFEQALHLYQQIGDQTGEARTRGSLGVVYGRQGQLSLAGEQHEQALALSRSVGDPAGEAWALASLGDVDQRQGRYELAAEHHRQALTLYQKIGYRYGEAWALDSLGTVRGRLGDPVEAVAYHQRALLLFREIGDRDGEAWALNGLGEATCDAGQPDDALAHHTAAHRVAREADARDQHARAHAGMGHAHRRLGDADAVQTHLREAWRLYTDLGMPEADQIRAELGAEWPVDR